MNDGEAKYNSNRCLFPTLKAKEWYKTSGFKELGMIHGTVAESYRKTTDWMNRIRYQEGATPMRTLKENTETEGTKILDFVGRKTTAILEKNNFTEEGIPKDKSEEYVKEAIEISAEEVKKAIEGIGLIPEEVAEIKKNPIVYEFVNETVNISIDDVGTRMQKDNRCKKGNMFIIQWHYTDIVQEMEGSNEVVNTGRTQMHADFSGFYTNRVLMLPLKSTEQRENRRNGV